MPTVTPLTLELPKVKPEKSPLRPLLYIALGQLVGGIGLFVLHKYGFIRQKGDLISLLSIMAATGGYLSPEPKNLWLKILRNSTFLLPAIWYWTNPFSPKNFK